MSKKDFLLRFYRIINRLPFNNRKKGKLQIFNDGSILKRCRITSHGINNKLIFAAGGYYNHCDFTIKGNNNIIKFEKGCRATNGSFYIEDDNNSIFVDSNTNFCGKIHLAVIEGTSINIGKDCLFSSDIVFRIGDSHSLLDNMGRRINPSKSIEVGNHVWVGHRVLVNKGAKIPSDSIVGTGAIVTKQFTEDNIVIAGVPAKIIKDNVSWNIKRI